MGRRRHGGGSSPLGSSNVIGGNRRAAQASARGTGRTAYTKDVSRTKHTYRGGALHERSTYMRAQRKQYAAVPRPPVARPAERGLKAIRRWRERLAGYRHAFR